MSITPKTDSQLLTVKDCSYVAPHPDGEYVTAEFARELERENAALRKQIAALGEIACLNLDDSTVGKCDAITGKGEKYKDVLRRIFVEQPKQIATLRGLLVEARDTAFPASITQKGISNALLDYRRELYQRIKEALKETQS